MTSVLPTKVSGPLQRWGLARLLRLLVILAMPPLWLEIAILHFRGTFHNPFMWLPVLSLPPVLIGGVTSVFNPDESRSRRNFHPLAWLITLVGAIGTLYHVRGVGRQMGGFHNWKYNIITGPPFPAPLQVALLGLLGIVASSPPSRRESGHLVRWVHAVNAASYLLLAIESGYNHWIGNYFNKLMYLPPTLSPLLALVHLGRLLGVRTGQAFDGWLSGLAVLVGLVGTMFHVLNIRRRPGGFWLQQNRSRRSLNWQNLFYGAPLMAPLQLTALGLLGLLAALFHNRQTTDSR